MGIKNLNALFKMHVKDGIRVVNLKEYRGKIMAIDLSIFLYRFLYSYGNLVDSLTKQIFRCLTNGIIPLYVFDGQPPKEKGWEQDQKSS